MQSGSQSSVARQAADTNLIQLSSISCISSDDLTSHVNSGQIKSGISLQLYLAPQPPALTIYLGSPSLKVNMISLWKSAPSYTGLRWTGHTHSHRIIIHTIQDTETVIHHQGRTRSSTVREVKQNWNQTILIISQQEPSYKSGSNNDSSIQHSPTIYWKNSIRPVLICILYRIMVSGVYM